MYALRVARIILGRSAVPVGRTVSARSYHVSTVRNAHWPIPNKKTNIKKDDYQIITPGKISVMKEWSGSITCYKCQCVYKTRTHNISRNNHPIDIEWIVECPACGDTNFLTEKDITFEEKIIVMEK